MREAFRMRTWAGPMTIGCFAVVGASGILMFFHLNTGLSKLVHEWLGMLMVIAVIAHLLVNWKPFLAYFRKPAAIGIMAVLVLLGGLSLLPAGAGPSRGHPMMAVSRALEQAPLGVVAQVAKRTLESATESLKAEGIQVRSGQQTIAEIAGDNDRNPMEILTYVLGNQADSGRGPHRRGA